MADVKITGLTAGTVKSTDVYPAVDVTDPTQAPSGTTKKYTISQLIQFSKFVATAVTTSNLTATYANGSSGVGATLTNSGVQAAFSVDGVTPAINSVILVTGQSSTLQNGIYTLTTVGSGAANWVLTRAYYYNQPAQILAGDLVAVVNGTTYGITQWMQTSTVVTVGTTAIVFSQMDLAGTGLTKTKNSLALTIPVVVSSGGSGVTSATAYAVLCGGTTSTGALQSIASVGTSGQYLGSNGAAALPTMKSFTAPQVTVYTSGSGTYTTPAGALYLEVQMVGGGSGGSGVGSSGFGSGGNGGDTTFGSLTAGGGADQAGGSASGGDINFIGEAGTSVTNTGVSGAAGGGSAFFGGAGAGGNNGPAPDANGGNAVANSGAGGGAPGTNAGISGQPAGSSGGSVRKTITTPSATYSYGVGAAGAGGTAGVDGATGGNGAAGLIYITAYFQ